MGRILCSTRGGEASVRTQEAAIQRAKESGDDLIFFYVSDLEFLRQANYALRTDVVTEELDKMGDFLTAMAVERAERAGVKSESLVKHGEFLEQLKAAIEEESITTVVLGRPAHEESVFELTALQELAENLQQETGVEVWIPPAPED